MKLHLERTITQEAMTRFAELPADRFPGLRRGVSNHHTDPEIARKLGLSGTVAQSLHYCAFVSQAMLEEYGERWLESGEMEMTFLRPVYAGDTLEIHFDDAPGTVVVNCTNQRGELVATGATRVRKE